MKFSYSFVLTSTLIWAVGCTSTSHLTQLAPVGPALTEAPQKQGAGDLEVYSARVRVPVDLNREEFFWNNDFGKNDFLYEPSHTSYTIYTADGALLRKVRNAKDMGDANPTLVDLPPGEYQIQAEAEDYGGCTFAVTIPVFVEPGLTTVVHLDGGWQPPRGLDAKSTVKLPNGSYVGWRAAARGEPGLQAKAISTSN